jgi:hypothetical protein
VNRTVVPISRRVGDKATYTPRMFMRAVVGAVLAVMLTFLSACSSGTTATNPSEPKVDSPSQASTSTTPSELPTSVTRGATRQSDGKTCPREIVSSAPGVTIVCVEDPK